MYLISTCRVRREERSTVRQRLRLQHGGFMNGVVIPSSTATKKIKIGESEYALIRSCARLRYASSIPSMVCQTVLLIASVKYMRINVPILDTVANIKSIFRGLMAINRLVPVSAVELDPMDFAVINDCFNGSD